MFKKTIFLILVGAGFLLWVGCSDSGSGDSNKSRSGKSGSSQASKSSASTSTSASAPRGAGGASLFRLPMVDGRPVTVKTPAALYFFTTWCGYCSQALPQIKAAAEQAVKRGWRVYGIDVNEGPEKVGPYVQRNQINFPVLLDQQGAVSRQYGIAGYPTFILIDENANIVYQGHQLPRNF